MGREGFPRPLNQVQGPCPGHQTILRQLELFVARLRLARARSNPVL